MSIVFGLGSGRCGTKTLQSLINIQERSVCFHEANPSCMAWSSSEHSVLSILKDFTSAVSEDKSSRSLTVDLDSPERNKPLERYLSLEKIEVVGDVASYYLPHVESIIENSDNAVFPCIVRDKDEVIDSFIRKLKVADNVFEKFYFSLKGKLGYRNHWSPSNRYVKDSKWDRLHPNVGKNVSLKDALSRYYDFYYEEADRLSGKYKNVKLYDIDVFSSEEGRKELLEFCGVKNPLLDKYIHANTGNR